MKTKKKILTPEEIIQNADAALQPWKISSSNPEENRLDVVIAVKDVKACTQALIEKKWGYLAAITGLDRPEYVIAEGTNVKTALPDNGQIEVLYHFCSGPVITTLRVKVPYANPAIDSICDIIPSATLYERETMELLGIDFVGTPSTEKLLLPDNWPAGVYPLRKSFTGLPKSTEAEGR
jgi:Ni,Fe-hydrogenase III component G